MATNMKANITTAVLIALLFFLVLTQVPEVKSAFGKSSFQKKFKERRRRVQRGLK